MKTLRDKMRSWFSGRRKAGIAKSRCRLPRHQLSLEILEDRTLLSGPPWSLPSILAAYDNGVQTVRDVSQTIADLGLGQQRLDIPILQESLSQALHIAADIEAPFQVVPDPNSTMSALISQLQNAGFTVQYLNTTPEVGTNDLLRVSYTNQWRPSDSFSVGGATGFSYLDTAQGQLTGSLQASVQPVVLNATFGVDVVNGIPTFYLSDSSSLTVNGVTGSGIATGQFSIGDLANVQASGTVSASLQASLGFNQSLEADHKLRLTDFSSPALVTGNINGSIALQNASFTTSIPVLSTTVTWGGNWTASINNTNVTYQGGLTAPDATALTNTLNSALQGAWGGLNLFGVANSFFGGNSQVPFVNETVSDLLGIGGWSRSGQFTSNINSSSLLQLIEGNPVDLLEFHLGGPTEQPGPSYNQSITLFSFGIPILASINVNVGFGFDTSYQTYLDMGVDSHGLWISNQSGVSANFTPYGYVEGSGNILGGLVGADIRGTLSFPVQGSIGVTGQADSRGRIYVPTLASLSSDLSGQFSISEQFSLTATISGLWGLISDTEQLAHQQSTIWSATLTNGIPITQQFALGNVINYQLLTNGDLEAPNFGTWVVIDHGVRSFFQASDGTAYELKNDGTLWHNMGTYQPGFLAHYQPGALIQLSSGVRSIADGPQGQSLYFLTISGQLLEYDGAMHVIAGNIQAMVQPANASGFFELHGGNLYWYDINGSTNLVESGVRSIADAGNGLVDALLANDVLEQWSPGQGWKTIDWNVQSIAIAPGGTLYALHTDNCLYQNGKPAWGNTQDFALGADGSVYWLATYGLLQRLAPNSTGWQDLDVGVTKFALRGDGTYYTLHTDNVLYQNGRAAWGNTQDFGLGADGSVYWLGTYGLLQRRAPGSTVWQDLDRNAQAIGVDSHGILYELDRDGVLERWGLTDLATIVDRTAQAMGVDYRGVIYELTSNGMLERWNLHDDSTVIDNNALAMGVDSHGVIYELSRNCVLERWGPTDVATIVDRTAQAMGVDYRGVIYELTSNGVLERWTLHDDATVLDLGVQSFTVANDKIFDLHKDGHLWEDKADTWTVIDSNILSFVMARDGALYDLTTSGTLKYYTANGWITLDTSVQSMWLGTDGLTLNALDANGTVRQFVN